jgi:hypothetical protein
MKKVFCDLCEEPAWDLAARVEVVQHIGEEYNSASPGNILPVVKQCKLVVRPVLSFTDHPAGFGGPPDICRNCLCRLLNALRVSLETGPGFATTTAPGAQPDAE